MEYVRITAVTLEPGLVLASNSPRRRELMALGGWKFTCLPADVDERVLPQESAAQYVQRLALEKAQACTASLQTDGCIIGADTAVVIDGTILGKPADPTEATDMLRRLRGRTHQVLTAIAVLKGQARVTDLCITQVPMRLYTDDEMTAYVASGDPLDKAGAYAIQHPGFHPVESLSGCYASVMGMPLCHLVRSLKKVDVSSSGNVPAACQAHLEYDCPISEAVLAGQQIG